MKYHSNQIYSQNQLKQIDEQNVLLLPLKKKIDNKINKILCMLGADPIRNVEETENIIISPKVIKYQKTLAFDQFDKQSQASTSYDPCNSRTFIGQFIPKDNSTTQNQAQPISYLDLEAYKEEKPRNLFQTIREAKSQVDSQEQASQISEVIVSEAQQQDSQELFHVAIKKCQSKSEGAKELYYTDRILQVPEEQEEELSNQSNKGIQNMSLRKKVFNVCVNQRHQRKSIRPEWDIKIQQIQISEAPQVYEVNKENKITQAQTIKIQKVRKDLFKSIEQAKKLRQSNNSINF